MPVCSGIVTREKDGSPVRGARVAGKVGGWFSGGLTDTVYTDRDGEFVLEWSTDAGLDQIYVNGRSTGVGARKGGRVHVRV